MAKPEAVRGSSETGDPLLLTPSPLTTSKSVKDAMGHDWGSRDAKFLEINREVLEWLPEIVNARATHVTVPMQGSGTFAVEAMLTTFVPRTGKVLLLVNGAYGLRAKRICLIGGRRIEVHETREDTPPDLEEVDRLLRADPTITHVFAVHCETTSGILNPVAEIAELVERRGRRLLVDAMSAFGALPLDAARIRCDAIAAASDKCIEGVAGAVGRGRPARPRPALCPELPTADRRHARAGLQAAPARSAASADHRHIPYAKEREIRLSRLLR
jgi:2-aminoethylphosphonate-pyruvate transaminase